MTFHVGVRATSREESRNVRLRVVVDIMGRENRNLLDKNLKADTWAGGAGGQVGGRGVVRLWSKL